MPFSGWLIDRFGARIFVSLAAVLCGVGWAGLGMAHTLPQLYVLYSMAGVGAALVYCGATGMGLKWFPDKLGLASGLVAAGFGSGACPFHSHHGVRHSRRELPRRVPVYRHCAGTRDFCSPRNFSDNPDPNDPEIAGKKPKSRFKLRSHAEQFTSSGNVANASVLRSLRDDADDGHRRLDGDRADFFGGRNARHHEDRFHRGPHDQSACQWRRPHFLGLGIRSRRPRAHHDHGIHDSGASLLSVLQTREAIPHSVSSFAWPLCFSPGARSIRFSRQRLADFFGGRHASSNYAFLYSSKGVASILAGGLAAQLFEKTGSWAVVFYGSATLAFLAALMAAGL